MDQTGGGGGVALSDTDPVSVGIASNSAGTAADASRQDHRHQVGRASATQFGVSTYATDAEALAGTSTTHAINPVSLAHVLANSGGTDTNDYVDTLTTDVSGTTLSVTLGRTGSLADLTSNVTLPSSGGGFSLQQIQDAMVSFLNFGNNITDTYDDPNNVYNINSADNYANQISGSVSGQELIIRLARTGTLADLTSAAITLPGGGGTTRENVEDWVNELIVPGLGVGASYNDAAGELTLSAATAPGNDYFFISLTSLSVTPSDGTINLTSADYAETTNTIVSFHLFHDFTTHVESQELGMRVNSGTRRAIYRYGNDVLYPLTAGDVIADGLYRFWRRDDDTWVVIAALPQMPDSPPIATYVPSYLSGRGSFEELGTTFEDFGLKANSSAKVPTSKLPITFNPSGAATESLDTLTYDGTVYGVRNVFDVISLSDRPAPGALTLGQGYFVNATGKLYIGIDDPHTSAAPDGDFTAQTTRTDLHFVDHLPTNLNNLTIGDFWFQRPIQEFYKLVQRAGVRNLEQVHPEAGLAGEPDGHLARRGVPWPRRDGCRGSAVHQRDIHGHGLFLHRQRHGRSEAAR